MRTFIGIAALVGALCACGSQPEPPVVTSTTPVTTTTAVDLYAGQALIEQVQWRATTRGRQLRVFPTTAGRQDQFRPARWRAWDEVITAEPAANTPTMRDQFLCHWDWARMVAPDKPSWNLELWRPDVGPDAMTSALCNPGGPEE